MFSLPRCVGLCLCVCLLGPGLASGQSADGRWEVEVHGGGLVSSGVSGGTSQLPAAAEPFTASSGRTSRRVSSWYFGDGAQLLSQVSTQLGAGAGIASLDSVLTSPLAERGRSAAQFGFRVSRSLSPRFAFEFSFDYSLTPLEVSPGTIAAIESSGETFATTWNALVGAGPFSDATVASRQTIDIRGGRQTFTTGTLNFNLQTEGRVIPYVAVGAGVVSSVGETPSVRLEGSYGFEVSSAWRLLETDRVVLSHDAGSHGLVGVVGGGVKLMVSRRWGVRVDARVHLSDTIARTVLQADPDVATLTPAGQLSSVTSPSLQLSNDPATGFPSSLSGPEVTEFTTLDVGGFRPQLSVSGGLLWRF